MKIFGQDGKKALKHQKIWVCIASNTADAYIARKSVSTNLDRKPFS
jgi:hypothetical protein